MSVGLKNTLVSRQCVWGKEGPLKVVVSKKSTEVGWMTDLSEMEGDWALSVDMKVENSSLECGHTPQISSRYLK